MNELVQAAKAAPLFNPLSPEFIRDPYPFYQQLRDNDPMHVTPFGSVLASRHAEASLVLRDKRFGKDFVDRSIRRYGPEIMQEPVFRSMSHWMLQQDPPDHTRLRGLVVKAFTARRVEDMRPRIQQIVDRTLDEVIPHGRMDLIEDFAFKLPVTVICDMLGIPASAVLAIGDGNNDIEMLRWAGRGVAVGDALEQVRAAADAVTADFDDDGTAVELNRWFG